MVLTSLGSIATPEMPTCGRPFPAATCQQSVDALFGVQPGLTFVATVELMSCGLPSELRHNAQIPAYTTGPRTASAWVAQACATPASFLFGLVPASNTVTQSVCTISPSTGSESTVVS